MTQIRGYAPNPFTGVAGSGEVTNAVIAFDNTTLGFYGATPVIQPTIGFNPTLDTVAWCTEIDTIIKAYGLSA